MASILAVHDSASIRQMVEYTLKSDGHDVVLAGDGEEALEFAKRNHVDVVVTDVNMPKMGGITLVKELRALDNYQFTPVLILTTESSVERKQEGRAAGATGWIVKPFEPDQFQATVRRVLD